MGNARIPEIETDRLVFRQPTDDDVEAWATFIVDPEDFRYMLWAITDETPVERAKRLLDGIAEGWQSEPPSSMSWMFTRKSDGQVVGLGGVDQVEMANEGEIGYRLAKPFRGLGYGKEAALALTRFAFENSDWDRIVAYVVRENTASVRLVESLGMQHVEDVDYLALLGNPANVRIASTDAALYALARQDFAAGDAPYVVRWPESPA